MTNGIELIEEQDARGSTTCLVEDLTNVTFGLTEPHSEELWSLNGDKVGRALIGDGLSEESLTTAWWAIEKNTLGGLHAELVEFIGMLDGVQDHFSKVSLDVFEATNVLPSCVGDLNNGLSE